ncbi:MAG: ECF transporter S component [Clostridia bacterium]|nr:ECF transporter S component [Clostridia bacterium]
MLESKNALSKRGQSLSTTRRLTLTAVFAALAFAVMFVFRFNVTFLTFDLKDTIITIAGLILGPAVALAVSLLVAVLEFITIGDTGWYGFLMNFASSATFSVVCAVVYRYNKKLSGAIIALVSGVIALVVIMLTLNLVVTPFYMGASRSEVVGMIPTLLLPFNAIKGTINAALVLILYKPIRQALQAAKLMPKSASSAQSDVTPADKKKRVLRSVCVTVSGLLLLTVVLILFVTLLHGDFSWVGKFTWFENITKLFGAQS